jgi:hypothetical protein
MAYNFPSSPAVDDTFTPSGGPTWTWNGIGWVSTSSGGSGGGSGGPTAWDDITDKPATFPPEVPIAQADITGLVTDQTAQNTAISGKAPTVHTHAQSDVTNLTTDLAGKAATVHTHAQADITNLTTDITAAKARANHTGTQTASTISDFSTAADARITAAIGVSVQAYDADLTSWSAIAPSGKADVASPSLTGTPLSTTAASTVNTTQIATTAFVKSNLAVKVTVASSAPGSPATNDVWIDTT